MPLRNAPRHVDIDVGQHRVALEQQANRTQPRSFVEPLGLQGDDMASIHDRPVQHRAVGLRVAHEHQVRHGRAGLLVGPRSLDGE